MALNRLNHTEMAKCSALWNASGRPQSAEILHELMNQQLEFLESAHCPERETPWDDEFYSASSIQM